MLGAVMLAVILFLVALVLYWAATNSLFRRLLQAHAAVMALHRLHPAARLLTALPLKLLVLLARHAQWFMAFQRAVSATAAATVSLTASAASRRAGAGRPHESHESPESH